MSRSIFTAMTAALVLASLSACQSTSTVGAGSDSAKEDTAPATPADTTVATGPVYQQPYPYQQPAPYPQPPQYQQPVVYQQPVQPVVYRQPVQPVVYRQPVVYQQPAGGAHRPPMQGPRMQARADGAHTHAPQQTAVGSYPMSSGAHSHGTYTHTHGGHTHRTFR